MYMYHLLKLILCVGSIGAIVVDVTLDSLRLKERSWLVQMVTITDVLNV
jgi:hypothetical protein